MSAGRCIDGRTPSERTYRRIERASWRLGPGLVLILVRGGAGYELTGTPALIWVALDAERSLIDLRNELADFGPPADLESCLDELVATGLVAATEHATAS